MLLWCKPGAVKSANALWLDVGRFRSNSAGDPTNLQHATTDDDHHNSFEIDSQQFCVQQSLSKVSRISTDFHQFCNGQKFRQLRTRLHHVFICVAQTVNTYNFSVLWLCRISFDCVMVKQLKRNSNWFTRKQSEIAPSVMDFSSTTVKKYIFKGILAQNRTRTIVFIVIGVYLYHF